jgi:hypothetical protein
VTLTLKSGSCKIARAIDAVTLAWLNRYLARERPTWLTS